MIKRTSYKVDLDKLTLPKTLTEFCGQPDDSLGKYLKATGKTAFEVEDINRRENYVFKYIEEENVVEMWETTNWDNRLLMSFPEGDRFPFSCKNSKEYFDKMFEKAIKIDMHNQIVFIGWVNPETFQPIEPKPDEY
jgi:hypothetical protein